MIRRTEESIELCKQVGERIRAGRLARGWSQAKLAEKVDLSLPHLGAIERGKSQIMISTLKKISEALNVSTDSLIRPNISDRRTEYQNEFGLLVKDCSPEEIEMLSRIVRQVLSYNKSKAEG